MCKSTRKKIHQSILVFILFTFINLIFAQTQKIPIQKVSDSDGKMMSISYEIRVEIIVTDRKGNDIYGLQNKDFIVYENGIEQDVTVCRAIPYLEKHSPRIKYRIFYALANDKPDGTTRKIRVLVKASANKKVELNYTPTSYVATSFC